MKKKISENAKSSYDDASSGEGLIAAQTQEKAPYARKIKLVVKRNGKIQKYNIKKIKKGVAAAYGDTGQEIPANLYRRFNYYLDKFDDKFDDDKIHVEDLQDVIEYFLMKENPDVAKAYILFRADRKKTREYVAQKKAYVENYKRQQNTADATIDDNSNVKGKNIGILNAEIHKADNIEISREMIMDKLEELFPEKDSKQYLRDLLNHILYKNDESNFAFAGSPYCVAATMYPFILNGIKDLGGLSAAPKNIDSFCGMYVNLVFALSAQFAGAVALPETLLYFTYFCKKEWGDDFWKRPDEVISGPGCKRVKTIRYQIRQFWQSMIYSINQPAAARGMQSAFTNFAYFDHPFFDAMFGEFVFPDGSRPDWESLDWIQREFMQWFNDERLRTILTFPVESFSLIYRDGKFEDEETARFVAEEYARGHSFFTYISDTVDSLSSCCRLRNKLKTREFSFTNGNMGIMTGSKSVITLNLSRITQDYCAEEDTADFATDKAAWYDGFKEYLGKILKRVYRYHTAYNEILWDHYDAHLLPVYEAGFIDLNRQYLTIGLNGLNEAARFMGLKCTDNEGYKEFCQTLFGYIKECNTKASGKFNNHTLSFNTELIPAESLAAKNYNWDKADGYWVPEDVNLYTSYVFEPYNPDLSALEKMRMHGRDYIGDFLDGGSAAHINLSEHLDADQNWKMLNYAGETGCSYFTYNIPQSECRDCGWIGKQPVGKCPHCGSEHIDHWDRIIGYLTKIYNWSKPRREEQKLRVYQNTEQALGGVLD